MQRIEAGDLEVAYSKQGDAQGIPVLVLHGWPDDASTWGAVVERLASGRRLIIPSLRGFGETRFRDAVAPRTGNSAILAMDAVALMDALGTRGSSIKFAC